MRLHKYVKKYKAFSLPEMMIVMVILALIMLASSPLVINQVEKRTKVTTSHGGFACFYDNEGHLQQKVYDKNSNLVASKSRQINDRDYCEFEPDPDGTFYTISMIGGGSAGSDIPESDRIKGSVNSDIGNFLFEYKDYRDYIWGLNQEYDPLSRYSSSILGGNPFPYDDIGVRSTFTSVYYYKTPDPVYVTPDSANGNENSEKEGNDPGDITSMLNNFGSIKTFFHNLFIADAWADTAASYGKNLEWFYFYNKDNKAKIFSEIVDATASSETEADTEGPSTEKSSEDSHIKFGMETDGNRDYTCTLYSGGAYKNGNIDTLKSVEVTEPDAQGRPRKQFYYAYSTILDHACFVPYTKKLDYSRSNHYYNKLSPTNLQAKGFYVIGSDEENTEAHAAMFGSWIRTYRTKYYGVNRYGYPGTIGSQLTFSVAKFADNKTVKIYPGRGGTTLSPDGGATMLRYSDDDTLISSVQGGHTDNTGYLTGRPFPINKSFDTDNERTKKLGLPILYDTDPIVPQSFINAVDEADFNNLGTAGEGGFTINRYILPNNALNDNYLKIVLDTIYTYASKFENKYIYPNDDVTLTSKNYKVYCADGSETEGNYCSATAGKGGGVMITW